MSSRQKRDFIEYSNLIFLNNLVSIDEQTLPSGSWTTVANFLVSLLVRITHFEQSE
jgi:hypothetical protein